MNVRMLVGTAGLLAVAAVAPAHAQRDRTCYVVVDRTGGVQRQVDVGGGFVRWFSGGGVWAHCRGEETRWYSDSVAWYQDQDRFDMIGHVDFKDATAQLTSERASYFLVQERLDAAGNAELRNRVTGSVLRGPAINYFRQVVGVRDTTILVATQRPTIEYRSALDSADAEPYVIVADRVQFRGNTAARAWGRVTIDRSDFHATSDSATLDTGVGAGRLMGSAQLSGGSEQGYHLVGRDVSYRLTGQELTWVRAEGDATAESAEWHVVADTVAFDLRDDRVQSGQAWGDSSQARAVSEVNTITADSLAIDAPEQVLHEVRGIGRAQAWSQRDSSDTEPDWIAGDSVVARFAPTAEGRSALDGIEASGAARALYRIFPEGAGADAMPDLSYSRGQRITAQFTAARLVRVDIVGQSDGVYLEAQRRREP